MKPTDRKWLLRRYINGDLQAKADTALDKKLAALVAKGVLKHYDAMFGNNYYTLTDTARAELGE